jgi:hypothetical protein
MVRNMPSMASEHDEMLEELPRERPAEFQAWLRELRLSSTATGTMDVDEVETLSDDCSGAGIGPALLDITDDTEPIVLTICGRDRRLQIR